VLGPAIDYGYQCWQGELPRQLGDLHQRAKRKATLSTYFVDVKISAVKTPKNVVAARIKASWTRNQTFIESAPARLEPYIRSLSEFSAALPYHSSNGSFRPRARP
jgi:hypothetical protein